jgi:hypothetical protein
MREPPPFKMMNVCGREIQTHVHIARVPGMESITLQEVVDGATTDHGCTLAALWAYLNRKVYTNSWILVTTGIVV